MELGFPQKGVIFRFIIPEKSCKLQYVIQLYLCIPCCSLKSPSSALITHWTSSPLFVGDVMFRIIVLSTAYSLNLPMWKSMKGVLWYWFLNTEIFLRHIIGFLVFFFPLRRKRWIQDVIGTWFIIRVWWRRKGIIVAFILWAWRSFIQEWKRDYMLLLTWYSLKNGVSEVSSRSL